MKEIQKHVLTLAGIHQGGAKHTISLREMLILERGMSIVLGDSQQRTTMLISMNGV